MLRTVSTLRAVPADPLTIVVRVNDEVNAGTLIENTARLTSPSDPEPHTAETSVRVIGDADLSVTKTDGQTSTAPGAVLTYTLVVRNAGPDDVKGARVSDSVPAALLGGWTCTASTGSSCPASGTGAIKNVLVDLLVDGTATFTLSATVDPAVQEGTIVNEATVTAPPDTMDPNPGNNTAIDNNTVVAQADIAVRKTVNTATPQVGQTVTFTVTATNNGPNPATGVQLSDGVPLGLTLVSATPSQGDLHAGTGDWDIGALAVNAQATLTLVVRVDAGRADSERGHEDAGDQFDPDTSNNSSWVDLTNQPVADIRVRKTADALVLPLGTDVTFTVTVTNDGPSAASGVELTDLLPAGLTFVSATPSQGTYTPTTGVWAIGALAVGAQTTLTLRATVQEAGEFTESRRQDGAGGTGPESRQRRQRGDRQRGGGGCAGGQNRRPDHAAGGRDGDLHGDGDEQRPECGQRGGGARRAVGATDLRQCDAVARDVHGGHGPVVGGGAGGRGGRSHGDVTGNGHGHGGRAVDEPGGEDRSGSTRSQPGERSGQYCPPGPAGGGPGGDEEQWRGPCRARHGGHVHRGGDESRPESRDRRHGE